jgi:hypothetical protein
MKIKSAYRSYIVSLCIACVANGAIAMDSSDKSVGGLVAGNTLFVTNKFGPSSVYFDLSGAVFQRSGDGVISEGTWRATADSVCSTMKPKPGGKVFPEFCLNIVGRKIGESWSGDDPRNGKIEFKLVPGDAKVLK